MSDDAIFAQEPQTNRTTMHQPFWPSHTKGQPNVNQSAVAAAVDVRWHLAGVNLTTLGN